MNKYQKKLERLIDKKKVEPIIEIIKKDTKGVLENRREFSSPFVDPVLYNKKKKEESKELFSRLCNFAFFYGHSKIFEALEDYEDFHFEKYLIFSRLEEHALEPQESHINMIMAIIKKFDFFRNGTNDNIIDNIIFISNKTFEKFKDSPFSENQCSFLLESVVKFIEKLPPHFFESNHFKNNKRQKLFHTLIKHEQQRLEIRKEQEPKEVYGWTFPQYRTFLKILYENDPAFLTFSNFFIDDFKTFKIIIKSMVDNFSSDYVFKNYLSATFKNGESVIDFIKKEKSDSYIQFLESVVFQQEEAPKIEYQFSDDYTLLKLKLKTLNGDEKFRLNIHNIGFINLKEGNGEIIIDVDNHQISINKNIFKKLDDYYCFKGKLENFIDGNFDDHENDTLVLK